MIYTQNQVNTLLEENTKKLIEKTFEGELCNDLVSKIGNYTFYSCSNLKGISFPNCTTLTNHAFYGCSRLKSINLPVCSSVPYYAFAKCSRLTNVSLPKATLLGSNAFRYCSNLTEISLPECETIRTNAFQNCGKLEKITLPKESVTQLLNANAFSSTPIEESKFLGAFGSIFVPASLVDAYKNATNWALYSDRIAAIEEA